MMPGWLLASICVAAAGIVPMLLGAPVAIMLLLLLPVAVECAREGRQRLTCAGAIITLYMACWVRLPEAVSGIALPWCAAGIVMLVIKDGHSVRRGVAWAGIGIGMLCMVSMILMHRYAGDLCEGVAEEIVTLLGQRPDAPQILLQCYQAGLCSLEDKLDMAVQLLGSLAVTGQIKQEMLYSLRFTLADSLNMLLPQMIVAWLMITAVLTAAVPDMVRRKRGLAGRLPPFGDWQLTSRVLSHLNVVVVLYLLVLFTDQPVLVMMGRLCGAAFQYAYMILGLAVMEGISKRHGTVRFVRRLWMAGCALFAPLILLILGVVDRGLDLRRLRHSTDDKGGY